MSSADTTTETTDEVEDSLRELGAKPVRREGQRDGRWVLIDFGDIVVHVQHDDEYQYYDLERLWRDCPVIPIEERAAHHVGARWQYSVAQRFQPRFA